MVDDLDIDDLEKLGFDETAAELQHRWRDSLHPRDLLDGDDSSNDP